MPFIEFEKSVRQDWSMLDFHSHTHYEIYFLTRGERSYLFADSLYKIEAPALIIIPPSAVHKSEGGPFERHNVNVSKNYLNAYQLSVLKEKKMKILKMSASESKKIQDLFEKCYSLKKQDKYYDFKQRAIFDYFITEIDSLGARVQLPQTKVATPLPSSVLKIIDYMSVNCDKNITLDKISKRFFISKTTLIYNFNKYVGRSPMDYLLAVRLNKARQLLATTKNSVEKISESCGFSSANYFGLIFKRKEGVSPLEYRRKQLEKE